MSADSLSAYVHCADAPSVYFHWLRALIYVCTVATSGGFKKIVHRKYRCRVRKLFRHSFINESCLLGMTKLNKKRVKWLVDQVVRHGQKPKGIAGTYEISERRVQQLVKHFRETKKYPELKVERRPKTFLTLDQEAAIDRAFAQTKLAPRLLYFELKARGTIIPKNKLYVYLKCKGLVVASPAKQKQRKRCRYEREHSGSLVHGDWHRTSEQHPHCILWLDDASRRILSGGEFDSPNAQNSIFDHARSCARNTTV